jgi:hypothetical protein
VRHALKTTIRRVRGLRRDAFSAHGLKVRGWIVRYGPPEVIGTGCAFLGSFLGFAWTRSEITAAYGGTLGELLGFYGTIIARDVIADFRATARASSERRGTLLVLCVRRALGHALVEFAPAEVLDASVLRPLAMGLGTNMFGRAWGVTAGKLLSDLAFYTAVVTGETVRRRRARVVASS